LTDPKARLYDPRRDDAGATASVSISSREQAIVEPLFPFHPV
jgi:hypothetical protein